MVRVGADIGGTFTDLVFLGQDGAVRATKLLSTPDDYGRAILDGLRGDRARAGGAPESIAEIVHGTTVATNAILEHKGAKVGLLTSKGFRDVLEIRRVRLPVLYDIAWRKPEPLGVALDAATLAVDEVETARLRAAMRAGVDTARPPLFTQ